MCQAGTRLAVLYPHDLDAAKDVLAIDDQESLTFTFSRFDRRGDVRPIVSALIGRSVATVVWDDGTFDERRVSLIDDGTGNGGLITVTANPLILDLAEGADSSTGKGLVSLLQNCVRTFDFTAVSDTATVMWDTYIIPACPSWVSRGTIDPTAAIPQLQWSRSTPQALALQVRDALRAMNISCELRLRRNGVTDYKLDLVTQIGASASVPLFHPNTSLDSLSRRIDTSQQSSRLFVTGETDPSGLAGIPGRARWLVTNVNGGTLKVTLADPNGGSGPIGFTNQWVGAYALRTLTGRTFAIQASDPVAQTITLLDVSTTAAGETFELRLTEPGTNTRVRATPNPRYAISAVGGSTLTLSSDPITVDNQHVDWYVQAWTTGTPGTGATVGTPQRISLSVASTDVITIASVSGLTTSHFVEFIQLDGAGEIPSYLEHPSALATYGAKVGDLAVSSVIGVTQIQPNPWMRTWSNSSNPPDGYSASGLSRSQNTNPAFIRYGPYSYSLGAFAVSQSLTGPATRPSWAPGNTRVSARCNVWVVSVAGTPSLNLRIYVADVNGSPILQIGVTSLAAPLTTGTWLTLEVLGVDLTAAQAAYGVVANLAPGGSVGVDSLACYVDTFEIYPFVANPTNVWEYGDATGLVQAGNRHLASNGAPLATYELAIDDLERLDPVTWSRNALTIGGNARAFEPSLGVDTTVRLIRIERDLVSPESSNVTLSNPPNLLTTVAQTR